MNKLEIFKGITELVVSIGVSSVVGNAIKMSTEPGIKLPKKIAIGVGGIVLSSMIADMATKYADEKIDTYADTLNRVITAVKLSDGTETIIVPDREPFDENAALIVNDEVTFSTYLAADKVKNDVVKLVREATFVSVLDLYILAGVQEEETSAELLDKIGWNTVKGFRVLSSAAGYVLKTPEMINRPTDEDSSAERPTTKE